MNPDVTPLTAQPATFTRDVAGTQGDTETMISTDFEFLRPAWPELASLGGFAENCARQEFAARKRVIRGLEQDWATGEGQAEDLFDALLRRLFQGEL
jgi:hypothetical protein